MGNNIIYVVSILILGAIFSSCSENLSTPASTTIEFTPASTVEPTPAAGDTRISKIDGMQMVYVSAGDFLMGNNNGAIEERPEHTVYLDGFWIDKTEVTNAMFLEFLKDKGDAIAAEEQVSLLDYSTGGSIHKDGDMWKIDTGYENYPVVNETWFGASFYCQWAERDLPSETQWEKAARGTDGRLYPWGNNFDCRNGNFDDETLIDIFTVQGGPSCDGFSETAPVGRFPNGASPYGALDMAGNAWEWVNDQYSYSYNGYDEQPAIIPTALTADELFASAEDGSIPEAFMDSLMEPDQYRLMRGGSWFSDETTVTTTVRDWNHILESTYTYLGFRCSITP